MTQNYHATNANLTDADEQESVRVVAHSSGDVWDAYDWDDDDDDDDDDD